MKQWTAVPITVVQLRKLNLRETLAKKSSLFQSYSVPHMLM